MSDSEVPDGRPRTGRGVLLIAAFLAVVVAVVTGLRLQSGRVVQAASAVQLGDTRAQVERILGVPDTWYNGGSVTGVCYGRARTVQHSVASQTRLMFNRQINTDFDDWPVHVRFDSTGAADRIKYGETVIEN